MTDGIFNVPTAAVSQHTLPTHCGILFDFDNICPAMINLTDVVASLSKICRYNGHGMFHYSVAQHSMYVADLVDKDPIIQLYALLHDGHEAYISDVVTPLKRVLKDIQMYRAVPHDKTTGEITPAGSMIVQRTTVAGSLGRVWDFFEEIETKIDTALHAKVGLAYPVPQVIKDQVKYADLQMVVTERDDLMPVIPPEQWWNIPTDMKRAPFTVVEMDWREVYQRFNQRLTKTLNQVFDDRKSAQLVEETHHMAFFHQDEISRAEASVLLERMNREECRV